MSRLPYNTPKLTVHGSVASLTLGKPGSDIDGASGLAGNRSMSDMTGGGMNAGGTVGMGGTSSMMMM